MASTVTKKNSLCRYFIKYGDCFHGEHCQYIHAYPPQSSPQPQPTQMEPPPSSQPQQTQAAPQSVLEPQQEHGYSMNKLICSFKSDLPNEIDFAIQVATVLANSDNFLWSKDYSLVDAICSSLHVFVCVCGDISTCYCYPRFWHRLFYKEPCSQYLQAATLPPDMEQSFMDFDSLENHQLIDQRKIYRRIKTAAELIKQFSMTCDVSRKEKNAPSNYDYDQMKKKKLKASPSLLKFVSLLLHCDDTPLNLIGLDILSNTASKLSKVPDTTNDSSCKHLVQMFHEYCAGRMICPDGDIYHVNRSMEVVSRLISCSSRRISSNIINLITEQSLVTRVEQFLTSHYDVTLFLNALELCYRISRHHPHLLTGGKCKYLMKILVNLLNCDDNLYFTPKALKRIKLIDEDDMSDVQLTSLNNHNHQVSSPLKVQGQNLVQPITKAPLEQQPNLSQERKVVVLEQNKIPTPSQIPPAKQNITSEQNENRIAPKPMQPTTKSDTPSATAQLLETEPDSLRSQADLVKPKEPSSDANRTPSAASDSSLVNPPTNQAQSTTEQIQPASNQAQTSSDPVQPLLSQPSVNSTQLTSTNSMPPPTNQAQQPLKGYACEWDNCSTKFSEAKQVYTHVFEIHVGPLAADATSPCLWSSPKGSGPGCVTKRPKYSLLTHLNDFHCNQVALERAVNRSQPPIKPPEHPGYAPNAALLAIKRHANASVEGLNGSKNANQSPISISVRLTAALILRNLATESADMKQALENHEPLLSEICMSMGRDESKIIAECLSLFSRD